MVSQPVAPCTTAAAAAYPCTPKGAPAALPPAAPLPVRCAAAARRWCTATPRWCAPSWRWSTSTASSEPLGGGSGGGGSGSSSSGGSGGRGSEFSAPCPRLLTWRSTHVSTCRNSAGWCTAAAGLASAAAASGSAQPPCPQRLSTYVRTAPAPAPAPPCLLQESGEQQGEGAVQVSACQLAGWLARACSVHSLCPV